MFEKLKQIKDLRSQAKTMQSMLAEEKITADKNGIKITINGNMEIISLTIEDKTSTNLEKNLTDCFNDAIKKTQKVMAQKMQEMGGLGNLGDLLK